MTKTDFLTLLGQAYQFPDYYAHNLDSAEEILEDLHEGSDGQLSMGAFFYALLADATEAERHQIWALLTEHFAVE